MITEKEKSLRELYRNMKAEEIEHRLASGQLTPAAIIYAQDELAKREKNKSTGVESVSKSPKSSSIIGFSSISGAVLSMAFIYWVMPDSLNRMFSQYLHWIVFAAIAMTGFAIGKLFPRMSIVIGWILILTPIWLTALMWSQGLLTMKYGDFAPLAAIVFYLALIIISALAMGLGAFMIEGSKNSTGPLIEIKKKLEAQGKTLLENIFK